MNTSVPEPFEPATGAIVRTVVRVLGLGTLFACFFYGCASWVSTFEIFPGAGERRETQSDGEAAARIDDFIKQANLPVKLHVADARAESVWDGFHGDGFDWYRGTLPTDEITTLRIAMAEHVRNGEWRASRRTSAKDGNPPDWWWPHDEWDLTAIETVEWHLWIGVSPSSGHMYLRRVRK